MAALIRQSEARMYPVAFSYKRFSSPSQEDGDSIRRQNALSVAWSERTGIPLDLSLTLEDRGVSGFRGISRSEPERYCLAGFLRAIEIGRAQPGDFLLIENLDRLSREQEVPATHLLTSILMTEVKVVQLSPYELELTDKSDGWTVMRAVMELSRGHGESRIKSERVCQAKAQRRAAAAAGKKVLTSRLPAWLEVGPDGQARVIAERAAVVKRIFSWAATGHGNALIVRRLTTEGIPAFGNRARLTDAEGRPITGRHGKPRHKTNGDSYGSGQWNRAYVSLILRDRRALGELESKGTRIQLPAIVSEEEWLAARAGAAERSRRPGRVSTGQPNVFAHLLHEAHTGSTFFCKARGARYRSPSPILVTSDGAERRGQYVSFPYDTFERAVLSHLREINPAELLAQEAPDETAILAGQLAGVQARRAELEAELLSGDTAVKAAVRVLGQLEQQEKELEEKLRAARQKSAHPLGEVWGQARTILDTLERTPDARLRLRSLLRQLVTDIRLLIVGRGADRLAAAQIWFSGGEHRDYLILHRPPWHDRPGLWRSTSLDRPGRVLDLRQEKHVQALEKELQKLDLGQLLE